MFDTMSFFSVGFPIFFTLGFLLIFSLFVVTLIRGVVRWGKNNASPLLTVEAAVVAKRDRRTRHSGGAHHHSHTHTSYYATFQVESGDRMELPVTGEEYGQLVEGDQGRLSFQGTRFKGFERQY